MKTETYFFVMPVDTEAFLCAVAAIQGLLARVALREIEPDVHVFFCRGDNAIFIPTIAPTAKLYPLNTPPLSRQYDLAFRFDYDLAHKIAVRTQKPLAQVFSIMLGGEPRVLPDLSALKIRRGNPVDILIIENQTLLEMLDVNFPDAKLVHSAVFNDMPLSDQLICIQESKLVVGVRSAATLIACALGKHVVEISPPSLGHREYLAKWGPNYQMIYMEPSELKPAMLYKIVEETWRRLERRDNLIPTAQ